MMSPTLSIEQKAPASIRLHNGQTFQPTSNESESLEHIPIIDIAGVFSDDVQARKGVAETIRKAAHKIGFFYIINHVSSHLHT